MSKLSEKMKSLAAAKKLSSSSPPAAHFHLAMREYHKKLAEESMRAAKKPKSTRTYSLQHYRDIINMHKDAIAHHNAEYKKANS